MPCVRGGALAGSRFGHGARCVTATVSSSAAAPSVHAALSRRAIPRRAACARCRLRRRWIRRRLLVRASRLPVRRVWSECPGCVRRLPPRPRAARRSVCPSCGLVVLSPSSGSSLSVSHLWLGAVGPSVCVAACWDRIAQVGTPSSDPSLRCIRRHALWLLAVRGVLGAAAVGRSLCASCTGCAW